MTVTPSHSPGAERPPREPFAQLPLYCFEWGELAALDDRSVATYLSYEPTGWHRDSYRTMPADLLVRAVRAWSAGNVATDAEEIGAIERHLFAILVARPIAASAPMRARRIAAFLCRFDRKTRSEVLQEVRHADPAEALAVRRHILEVGDLARLSPSDLTRVIELASLQDVVAALRDEPDDVRATIISCVPGVYVPYITQSLADPESAAWRRLPSAGRELLEVAARLIDAGTISWPDLPET